MTENPNTPRGHPTTNKIDLIPALSKDIAKPIVKVRPHNYQPSKAEKEEHVGYNALPDEAVKALFRQVIVKNID
ncbi:MAG: hypothetical protein O7G31_06185 [Calditrichaeota bacterium]|nr:hypothetical protein [Calditrichota bacterium]